MQSLYRRLTEIESLGEPAALCVVTKTQGSTPLKAGAKMIVWANGEIFGTIGGGSLELKVIEDAVAVIAGNKPETFEHHLVQDHQMCCGGSVYVYIEPVTLPMKLYIFGAGHVGKQVAEFARALNFKISLIDERQEMLAAVQHADIDKFTGHHRQILPGLSFDERTFIVICTHLHQYDREILAFCIKKPFAYLGMIGSKRKVAVTRRIFLQNEGISEAELAKVDMPMGFDIGGNAPAEIALSILAKIIAVKNNKAGEITQSPITQSLITQCAKTDSDSFRRL